jgi:hypothetical protein
MYFWGTGDLRMKYIMFCIPHRCPGETCVCTVRWTLSLALIGVECVEQAYRVLCKAQMLWDSDIHMSIVGRKELEDFMK